MPANKPEDLHTEFGKALVAGDLDRLAYLYEDDACLVTGPGEVARGKAEIREALASYVALEPRFEIFTVSVLEGGGDLATLEARWKLRGTAPDGSAVETAGTTREVARRNADGVWLYVIDDPGVGR